MSKRTFLEPTLTPQKRPQCLQIAAWICANIPADISACKLNCGAKIKQMKGVVGGGGSGLYYIPDYNDPLRITALSCVNEPFLKTLFNFCDLFRALFERSSMEV